MKRIQLLVPDSYWTQRKDTDSWAIQCQVTSGANFLMAMGLYPVIQPTIPRLPGGDIQRLPDYINDVAESAEGAKMAAADGWTGAPREDHKVLAWAINKVAGSPVNLFQVAVTLEQIFFEISRHRPVIISGVFGQYKSVKDGEMHDRLHVVCLTGMETDQDDLELAPEVNLAQISAGLVADPYGDYHTNYTSENGAECRFTVDELLQILNDRGRPTKWAHLAILPVPKPKPSPSAVENEKTGAETEEAQNE